MIKRTKDQVWAFAQWAARRVTEEAAESKLKYALEKMLIRCRPILAEINEQWEDIDLKYAHTDADGVLVKKDGQYTYDKDSEQSRVRARRDVFKQTVSLQPFYVDMLPPGLSEADKFFGAGFVFTEEIDINETA